MTTIKSVPIKSGSPTTNLEHLGETYPTLLDAIQAADPGEHIHETAQGYVLCGDPH